MLDADGGHPHYPHHQHHQHPSLAWATRWGGSKPSPTRGAPRAGSGRRSCGSCGGIALTKATMTMSCSLQQTVGLLAAGDVGARAMA